MTRAPGWTLAVAVFSQLLASCLPADDRPSPGRLLVTVSGDDALQSGFATEDGWDIVYDRFLLSVGNGTAAGPREEDGTPCAAYSDESTYYLRILDLLHPASQKIATSYALGECNPAFQLFVPTKDALLGPGVAPADRSFMRTIASDSVSKNSGVVLYVKGHASRFGATVRFEWPFRQPLAFRHCADVSLQSDASKTMDIVVRGSVLFQNGLDGATSMLTFNPYAEADADGDGNVTLDELEASARPADPQFGTLASLLYRGLVPLLPQVHDRPCVAQMVRAPGEGEGHL